MGGGEVNQQDWQAKYESLDRQFPRVRLLEDMETNGGTRFKRGDILRVSRKRFDGAFSLTDGLHEITCVEPEMVQVITSRDDADADEVRVRNQRYIADYARHWTRSEMAALL